MQEQRKNIILKEIAYWKESKMLPEHYCDYLITLYTEGMGVETEKKSKRNKWFLIFNTIYLALIPVSIYFFYFTELSFILQIAISLIFLFFLIGGLFLYNKNQQNVDIPAASIAIQFLLLSVAVVIKFFAGEIIYLYIILYGNCFIWYMLGKKYKLLYFTLSAYIGVGLLTLIIIIKLFL